MIPQEDRADDLLGELALQIRSIGIPVSASLDPHVRFNDRAKRRFGCCWKTPQGGFVIELSAAMRTAPEAAVRQVLAHELLHTCPGCFGHGIRWKTYAAKLSALGLSVSRTADPAALGVALDAAQAPRYRMVCQRCGRSFFRSRASSLVLHPARYRCVCGGSLQVIRLKP